MKISARNSIPAKVRTVVMGPVNAEVRLEIAPGLEIISVITKEAVENLGLIPGGRAYAIIKASSVMVGVD
jgi:molybdopterin-binding protein